MTEEIQTRKVSVTFERKLDLGDYQNVTARAWVEDSVPIDAPDALASEALSSAFGLAKAAVFDELGIEVILDDAGVLREKHNPSVTKTQGGGVAAARRSPDKGGLGATGGFSTGGLEVANMEDLAEDIPQYVVDICNKAGVTKVWANNGKFGPFYKEHVVKGEQPKLGTDSGGRTLIIKSDMKVPENDSF